MKKDINLVSIGGSGAENKSSAHVFELCELAN